MKKIISVVISMIILTSCAYAYTDVAQQDWFYPTVTEMSEKGILTGYEDGSFRPSATITYAEYITILKRIVTGTDERSETGHWAKKSLEYAYENSWYDYDEINESACDSLVPRQLAAKLTALAFDIPKTENDDGVYWKYMQSIADFDKINGRYAYLVIRCYNNGILTGDEGGCFNPDSPLTRAEACAIISRASALSGKTQDTVSTPVPFAPPAAVTAISGGVSENGQLRVEGTKLVNQAGQPVVLRGMSSHGIHWYPQFASSGAMAALTARGANLFRVAAYSAEGGYTSDPDGVLEKTFAAADNAISNDMYVIIDWHILSDGDPLMNADKGEKFLKKAAERYKDSPAIIYEICNEPNGGVSWSGNVKPYAERVIPAIRTIDPDAVILVGSPQWSQNVNEAADDPLSFDNIMYTCHFYAGTHGQWLRDRIDYALGRGAPIFISEWGTSAADGNGGIFLDESREWLDFLNQRGISWANWSLCDKSETSAALAPGASANGGWTENDLSESGKFVFANFGQSQ